MMQDLLCVAGAAGIFYGFTYLIATNDKAFRRVMKEITEFLDD